MRQKWLLFALLHYEFIIITSPTIAGITYMDDYDFGARFRDVNECDPFYWHPLHLPEVCADMFEKLIRSKIGGILNQPARIMTEIRQEYVQEVSSRDEEYSYSQTNPKSFYANGWSDSDVYSYKRRQPKTPFEKMLELLEKDVRKNPSLPKIEVLPNLGPVALYNQEISKRSENMIKNVASAYANYYQEMYANYMGYNEKSDPQLYIWDSDKNKTVALNEQKQKKKKNDRITRTKTKQGGVITIVETLKPRRRRSLLTLN